MIRSLLLAVTLSCLSLFTPLAGCCPNCQAQWAGASPKEGPKGLPGGPPQVDQAEVIRRGDMVVITGEGPRAAEDDAIRLATAPPPDDSFMWYVTVIKTNGCTHCEKLIADFQKAPELLAFVAASEPHKAWAHFNIYNINDQTQQWRLKAYQLTGYPTLVIQPPRNGMWGNPRTVVWQKTGYEGNPKKLSSEMTAAVRKYAAAMAKQGYPKQVQTPVGPLSPQGLVKSYHDAVPAIFPEVKGGAKAQEPETQEGAGQVGVDPPFTVPPKVDPFNPMPVTPSPNVPGTWPPLDQQPPANPTDAIGMLMSLLLQLIGSLTGSTTLSNLILLAILVLRFLEWKAPQTETKVDDAVVAVLQRFLSGQKMPVIPSNPPAPVTPPNT